MKWTEAAVIDRLRSYFHRRLENRGARFDMLTQVAVDGRIIDALVMLHDPTVQLLAFEVKVSRADYRNETDAKRAPAWAIAHQCLYITPIGLLPMEWIPTGWGLMEVDESGGVHTRIPAQHHSPAYGEHPLAYAAFERAAVAEDAIRRGDTPAHEVARLRFELDRHAASAQRAQTAREEYRRQAVAARSQLLAAEGMQECADCGKPVTWLRKQQEWTHIDAVDQRNCHTARAEANRRQREKATGAAYAWGFPGDVEPKAIRDAMSA